VKYRILLVSAGVIALLILIAALGHQSTARADTSSMDYDVLLQDPTNPDCSANNNNGVIDVGECPRSVITFDIDVKDAAPNEPFFDGAVEILKTGPAGTDLDGDTLPEPTTGIAQIKPTNAKAIGTTIGSVLFTLKSDIVLNNVLNKNIDDAGGGNNDSSVAGQPAVCGGANTAPLAPPAFALWEATKTGFLVNHLDSAADVDSDPQTQADDFSLGDNCSTATPHPATADGMPDGVDCVPDALPYIQTNVIGLPLANYSERLFGIANLPVGPTHSPVDVNFLYYNFVGVAPIDGYVQVAVVQYPGVAGDDPFMAGYDALKQTVITCGPYTTAVTIYGTTQDSKFPSSTHYPAGLIYDSTPHEVHRQLVGGTSSDVFNFEEMKSTTEDWDGDTIPTTFGTNQFDRCILDPASGTDVQDTDGDYLTGFCENPMGLATCTPGNATVVAGYPIYWNCEGASQSLPNGTVNNPMPGGPNSAPPWDSGQDVDGDGYLNGFDNCPNIPDRDLDNADGDNNPATGIDYQLDTDRDGVGDVCEIGLVGTLPGLTADAVNVPGNGQGYPGQEVVQSPNMPYPPTPTPVSYTRVGDMYQVVAPGHGAPGQYIDRDNYCVDGFSPGTAEPAGDTANRTCIGMDFFHLPGGPSTSNDSLWRQFADSNDDSIPDLVDYPASQPTPTWHPAPTPSAPYGWPGIEYMDVVSDTDADGHTDACEAFMGSDPLDHSSVPVYNHAGVTPYTPTAGDCDGDTIPDATDPDPFTNLDPDADMDGCSRSEESYGAKSTAPAAPGSTCKDAGGSPTNVCYQDSAWYDFYDVPTPSMKGVTPGTYTGGYSGSVTISDVLSVNNYNPCSVGQACYEADVNQNGIRDGIEYDRAPSQGPNPPNDVGPPSGAIGISDVLAANAQSGLKCLLGKKGW
jgi:hypothetical protein